MRLLSPESCVLSTGDAIVKAATCSVGVMNCKNERRCIYMHVFALHFGINEPKYFPLSLSTLDGFLSALRAV